MLKIIGKKPLSGCIKLSGSKNAALPLIAFSTMFRKATITNVPNIADVRSFRSIIDSLGYTIDFSHNNWSIQKNEISLRLLDTENIKKIRVGILLIPSLYQSLGTITLPTPGGCAIGARSIDEHIAGFRSLGLEVSLDDEGSYVHVSGDFYPGDRSVRAGFGVTSTENIFMMSLLRAGKTIISYAAIEPHVINLIDMARQIGFQVEITPMHEIIIEGNPSLFDQEVDFEVQNDPIEAGTYMIIGALASDPYLDIEGVNLSHLGAFLPAFERAGGNYEVIDDSFVRIYRTREVRSVNVQTNIFPGFPTDLQSPFSIMLTQAEGDSMIHEILFESRLNWLAELESLKGKATVLNPHQAMIHGGHGLRGGTVASWDLRAGVAMVIAGLIADGETHVTNIKYIDRGYEDIIEKLQSIGADIVRIDDN